MNKEFVGFLIDLLFAVPFTAFAALGGILFLTIVTEEKELSKVAWIKYWAFVFAIYGAIVFRLSSSYIKRTYDLIDPGFVDTAITLVTVSFGIILYHLLKRLISLFVHIAMWQKHKKEKESFGTFLGRLVDSKKGGMVASE